MDFSFTEEHKILRENIVRFARQELNKEVSQRDRDRHA